jgi:hypothetical protein
MENRLKDTEWLGKSVMERLCPPMPTGRTPTLTLPTRPALPKLKI